jgi:hypothetical protein
MDVFDGNLKTIEKLGFGVLNLAHKMLGQVLVNNTIAGSKECQDMGNEIALPVVQVGPVAEVMTQVNLLGCPKTGFGLLIKLPNVMVYDRKKYEPVFILLQDRLFA